MIKERMLGYYPQIIKSIEEFKAIINAEYPEFELLDGASNSITENAYLPTMGLERIQKWENILGITPLPDTSLEDRRETIIARIRGKGKLNTELINSIVNVFTGGQAISWIENSTLYVLVTTPRQNKEYKFENIKQELALKVPAHLGFSIDRKYFSWGDIKDNFDTWFDVQFDNDTWEDVYFFSIL